MILISLISLINKFWPGSTKWNTPFETIHILYLKVLENMHLDTSSTTNNTSTGGVNNHSPSKVESLFTRSNRKIV